MSALRAMPTLVWGIFCACSWTWCIGMFLPAIMLRDFGWWGFVVFAAPNVLGCAAFGYVVKSPERSRALVARHRGVMAAFSWVTIAFHMFFIAWLMEGWVARMPGSGMAAAGAVLAVGMAIALAGDREWLGIAAVTYAVSLMAFSAAGTDGLAHLGWQGGEKPLAELWLLAPAIAFGFLTCPYLDLTFHRALQQSPSRHCFAVFGAAFTVMIVLTCFIWHPPPTSPNLFLAVRMLATTHIFAQSCFTVGAHARELMQLELPLSPKRRWSVIGLAILAALLGMLPGWAGAPAMGEDIYLRFLGFYGWVFPACVVLAMWMWRGVMKPRRWMALAAIIAAGLPLFEMGFIHDRAWMTLIAIGALGATALIAKRV